MKKNKKANLPLKQGTKKNKKIYITIIVITIVIIGISTIIYFTKDNKKIEENTRYFTGNLYTANHAANLLDYAYNNKNIIISPLNINSSLAIIYNATDNNSTKELKSYFKTTPTKLNEELKIKLNTLEEPKKEETNFDKLYKSYIKKFYDNSYDNLTISAIDLLSTNNREELLLLIRKIILTYSRIEGLNSYTEKEIKNYKLTSKEIKYLDKLVQKLNELGEFGLYININNQHNSIILGREYIHIAGIKAIELEEFGIKYDIDVASFLQVNNEIKSKLYSDVISSIGGGVVIDAYAGAGLLSATLSKGASKVYSVEIVPEASEKARQLVKANNITNMEVINGDCTKIVPNLIKKIKNESKDTRCSVVLDPAHVGCSPEVIESVKIADQIIYIACNPIALAKDLKVLQTTHKIVKIEPYDMFPQTKHIETLAILQRSCDN